MIPRGQGIIILIYHEETEKKNSYHTGNIITIYMRQPKRELPHNTIVVNTLAR